MTELPLTDLPAGATLNQSYAVRRIICIGRNYAEHAREMGHDPEREAPFFFFKPITALALSGSTCTYPSYTSELHYELELVVALGQSGHNVTPRVGQALVSGFGLGLDMTCRDTQKEAKAMGRPWDLAKGFDGSAPCTPLCAGSFDDMHQLGAMQLFRNGELVQQGDWRQMVWSVGELISHISQFVTLGSGDIIFTGTPAGVGPVQRGDRLSGKLEGLPHTLSVDIT